MRRRARIEVRRLWHAHRRRLAVAIVGLPVDAARVELAVGAPPRADEQVRRLAAEHAAFAPDVWTAKGRPD